MIVKLKEEKLEIKKESQVIIIEIMTNAYNCGVEMY